MCGKLSKPYLPHGPYLVTQAPAVDLLDDEDVAVDGLVVLASDVNKNMCGTAVYCK